MAASKKPPAPKKAPVFANVERANEYAKRVVAGKIPACRYVQLACKRHLDDLKKSRAKDYPYRFDPAAADRVCRFVQLLPHTKGEWAYKRQLITLEPWQAFIFCALFGWLKKKDGTRRFREAYDEIPRKNGKSVLAAGVALYMFCADNEFGAEVYAGATTEKQAWEVFRPAKLMAQRSPHMVERFGIEINAASLVRHEDGSRLEPLIGSPGDGASPHCAVVDEYHEHDTAHLYETMLTGMGARKQPLMFVITTSGASIEGPCYTMRKRVIDMLEGVTPDEELFGIIYTLDAGDDWKAPAALIKANPNYGVSIYSDFLIAQQQKAVRNASAQNAFKTKHANVWVTARSAYFNMERWNDCFDPALKDAEGLLGKECIDGLDLASKTDLCSKVRLFPRDGDDGKRHYLIVAPKFWLPESALTDGESLGAMERYQRWANAGLLEVCDGAEVGFADIGDDVIEDSKLYALREVAHDPWGAFELAQRLEREGLTPVKIPQNVQHLSPAMKELNAAILSGRVRHDGNPILAWCLSNVVAKEDANENVFPRKEKRENKIDGAVALLNAICRAMVPVEEESVYEMRGLRRF